MNRWYSPVKNLTLILAFAFPLHLGAKPTANVLDLGAMEWKGKVRGPQVEMLDSNRMSKEAAGQLTEQLFRQIEDRILGTRTANQVEEAQ